MHAEEMDIDALLAYAYNFILTLENTWYDAPIQYKIKLQRLIFLEGLEYKEKGGLLNLAKISINGGIKLDIKGPSKEVRNMFKILECLINSK